LSASLRDSRPHSQAWACVCACRQSTCMSPDPTPRRGPAFVCATNPARCTTRNFQEYPLPLHDTQLSGISLATAVEHAACAPVGQQRKAGFMVGPVTRLGAHRFTLQDEAARAPQQLFTLPPHGGPIVRHWGKATRLPLPHLQTRCTVHTGNPALPTRRGPSRQRLAPQVSKD
jgi:hypothetical protein